MWAPGFTLHEEKTGFTEADKAKVLKAGQVLFEAGSKDERAYRIEDGEVGLYVGEKLVGRLQKGAFVGAYAVLGEEAQPYTVKGLASPMTYLSAYPGIDVRNAFSANPELAAILAMSLDVEAAAIEIVQLDAISDIRLRILRAREFIKDRRTRILERLSHAPRTASS